MGEGHGSFMMYEREGREDKGGGREGERREYSFE